MNTIQEQLTKFTTWLKANKMIGILLIVGVIFLLFGRQVKRLLFSRKRVKHRPGYSLTHDRKGNIIKPGKLHKSNKKPLPRSVGTKGYPAAGGGYIPFKYNKDGSIKKAKFVAGTVAAKSYMSHLRKQR